jgi:hypothetical protein
MKKIVRRTKRHMGGIYCGDVNNWRTDSWYGNTSETVGIILYLDRYTYLPSICFKEAEMGWICRQRKLSYVYIISPESRPKSQYKDTWWMFWNYEEVQIFWNESNISKLHSRRNL